MIFSLDPGEDVFWTNLLLEDAPEGDSTSLALEIPAYTKTARIFAKEELVLSGSDAILPHIPKKFEIETTSFFQDGQSVLPGQCIALFEGPWQSLILLERPILNWIGRLSGIATLTKNFVNEVSETKCKILDTRKTIPFFRTHEKKAVVHGGGQNHRTNLSDEMMLKENHLSLLDFNIKKAVQMCKSKYPNKKLTVEARNLADVELTLKTEADQILLDNFSNEEIFEALGAIRDKMKIEASGNMTLERVKSVAQLGVDFISVGALTHSAPQADLTMLMEF